VAACRSQGFVVVEGQALAYVPIDFADADAYLARLSYSSRKNLRRKLRSRAGLTITTLPTGPAFADDALVDAYYALYRQVYAQSEVHFDELSRGFLPPCCAIPPPAVWCLRTMRRARWWAGTCVLCTAAS